MGTRGITAVVIDGEFKIAQYGQWDHYPSGQGKTILAFCREWLSDPEKTSQFVSNLMRVQEVPRQVLIDRAYKLCNKVPVENAMFLPNDVADSFMAQPEATLMNRDVGGDILEAIATGVWSRKKGALVDGKWENQITEIPHEFFVELSTEFLAEGLYCEWAYVVDLDGGFLEVYKGCMQSPVPPGQRFSHLEQVEPDGEITGKYYPVHLAAKFSLDDLPTQAAFEAEIKRALGGEDVE